MRSFARTVFVLLVTMLALGGVTAQQSTPQLLKVQGFLSDQTGGPSVPANGTFNMTFSLFDDEFAGLQHGSTLAKVVTVVDGVYDVSLDFDTDVFAGPNRWIEISVEGETLSPRVRAFSTPYAFRAEMLDDKDSVDLDQAAAVASMQTQIASLQATVAGLASLQGQVDTLTSDLAAANLTIASLQANSVLALDGKLSLVGDTAQFSGVNVQVINGVGEWSVTGLGNLIVGYDSARTSGSFSCSNGSYDNQTDCENNFGVWALSHKTGSHNLVVGPQNNYSSMHGFVVGQGNDISREGASVSGGRYNRAVGLYASVSGGANNTASGGESSVSGGQSNLASGNRSSVSGGSWNTSSSSGASVSGGQSNIASGDSSSVSGGSGNTASSTWASVSGDAAIDAVATGLAANLAVTDANLALTDANLAATAANLAITDGNLAATDANVATLQSNSVLALDGKLTLNGNTALFSGVNVQVHNGSNEFTVNGLGNLIVGYDSVRASGSSSCSIGSYDNQTDCESNSGTWALSHKTGSHNLVVGPYNNYSSRHGFVAGQANDISMPVASVSGGTWNRAAESYASVNGGLNNTASAAYSTVSGGESNTASGYASRVGGGHSNEATGEHSSVNGGLANIASGGYSSANGGHGNEAVGTRSSVGGGFSNTASGQWSSVMGGSGNAANGVASSVSGDDTISVLMASLAATDAAVAAVQANSVLQLDGKLSLNGGDTALFSGVNVQVHNGSSEWTVNGLGNLIVGYDSDRTSGDSSCSIGSYDNQTNCESNSGTWSLSHKTGSHNLVVGPYNNYSSRHGFVAGQANDVSMPVASVSGGVGNRATAVHASVSGGLNNTASGSYSSVLGGEDNEANGNRSTVAGGQSSLAQGAHSSVAGGQSNTAFGAHSSVAGGQSNAANGANTLQLGSFGVLNLDQLTVRVLTIESSP